MKTVLMRTVTAVIAVAFMATLSMSADAQMTKEQKDECLLASKNCSNEVDSIQMKMKKLQAEIKKGKKVYNADELKKLQEKLKEANEILDTLQKGQ